MSPSLSLALFLSSYCGGRRSYNVVSPASSVTHDQAFSLSQLPQSHHMGLKLGIHVMISIIATNDCYLSHVKLQLV